MGLNPVCPECGFVSNEVRCPRCNALKVVGCTGSCFMCGNHSGCQKRIPSPPQPPKESAQNNETPQ